MMNHETGLHPAPKLLTTIVDRSDARRLEDILHEKHVPFHFIFHAMGTASSEMLQAFGLSGTEKAVCICMVPESRAEQLMTAVAERLELTRPGNGIVFVIPVSGISATLLGAFSEQCPNENRERWTIYMEQETEKQHPEVHYELVTAIVEFGFSEKVMDAARASGARGGTIINARRSGMEDASKFFGICLQAEKEIVTILIPKRQKKELMQAISKSCGAKTEAHGIVISLPVDACSGIDMGQAE